MLYSALLNLVSLLHSLIRALEGANVIILSSRNWGNHYRWGYDHPRNHILLFGISQRNRVAEEILRV